MIILVTRIWNHYFTNICRYLVDVWGDENFRLLLVTPRSRLSEMADHMSMGWSFDPPENLWIVKNPETEDQLGLHERFLLDADVALVGDLSHCRCLFKALRKRASRGKLTLVINERFFKTPPTLWESFSVINLIRWYRMHILYAKKTVHYLPISHFGAEDMRFLDGCRGRIWRWTYTPEVSHKVTEKENLGRMRIGWCGRVIPWKHVEHIVQALALMPREYQLRCFATLVGEGECKKGLIDLVKKCGLDEQVEFMPYRPVKEVTELMMKFDVYVFPSDRNEGWGVALAEAMDKCCVPVACVEAGATLDLVDDGENGFVFEKGDCHRIAHKLMWLVDHPAERREMGIKAWETMQERSPQKAASRLIQLVEALRSDDMRSIPKKGICAPIKDVAL